MTDWQGLQARVHPGEGIVARTAAAALVLPGPMGRHEEFVEELLSLMQGTVPDGGRALVRRLAGMLASRDSDDTVDLALLTSIGDDDLAVMVVGDVDLSADGPAGPVRVSGRDSLTWVDRVLRAPTRLIVTSAGSGAAVHASDLVQGVVPGGGLTFTPRIEVAADPASSLVPPPVPEFQVESLSEHDKPVRPPLPVDQPAAPIGADSAPSVEGVFCKSGHFNDPMAAFCTVCGTKMVQQAPAVVDGPRPPLGVLVFDDDSVFQLDQNYVLGRQPDGASQVVEGSARPLRLDDVGGTVSRTHALIELEDWTVRISDLGSANGTYIAPAGTEDWRQVPQNGRIELTPGTTIKLGNRALTYESHRDPG